VDLVKAAKTLPSIFKLNEHLVFWCQKATAHNPSFASTICNQLVLLTSTFDTLNLRGQFQDYQGAILFVGSPWFVSMEK
jgi:hypothetical protein